MEQPEDTAALYEVSLFGRVSVIGGRFTSGTVTHLRGGGAPAVGRAALVLPAQIVELQPWWSRLAPRRGRRS